MKHILLVFLLFLTVGLSAQTLTFSFKGTVTNQDAGNNESGVTVSIVQGGSTLKSVTSGSNGKYTLEQEVNYLKPFTIVFSKNGLVTKKVDFDFTGLNEEDIPAGSVYKPLTDLSLSLFAPKEGVDFSFMDNEPVAKFGWNPAGMAAPDNAYNSKTKAKIDKLLAQGDQNNAANEAKYQALIKEADNLYLTQKQYKKAQEKYEEALMIKPKEKYPADRILELDALIQAEEEKALAEQQADSEYLNLIKSADLLRDQKKYDQAIAKYNEALAKKENQYPRDQITLIEGLKKEAENDAKFQELVKAADMFYNQKSMEAAKEKYLLAQKLKPSDAHVKTRLAEIDKKMTEQNAAQAAKQKYQEAVDAADALFNEEKYLEAKAKYNEALTFEDAATYPVERIKECDAKLLEIAKDKERIEKIAKLLGEGNTLFGQTKWQESKAKYLEVIALDPTNAEAKARLDEIELKIEESKNQAALDAKFTKLVTEGDLASKALKYPDARAKYEEALGLKADPAVQAKLDDVIKKIKELEDKELKEAEFNALKAEGMKLAGESKWLEAKSKLLEAQAIKTDAQITLKLKEIEEKIKANEALVQLEKEYNDLITAAQTKESALDYDGAIAKYKEALVKKPNEKLPKDKITELEALKLNSSKQKEIDAKYAEAMKKGKDLMDNQKYLDAIKEFNLANTIKPEEREPIDLAEECERLEKAKGSEADALFEKILAAAQNKIDEKDYVKAKELLVDRAMKMRPEDQRPKDMLKFIENVERIEKEYNQKMQEAELQASAKNYEKAIVLFEQAKVLKPEETKPQERIDAINELIKNQASAAEKLQLYKDFMTKGNLSMSSESYDQALIHFQNALSVKPDDQVAKDKIEEVQQILDDKANALKSDLEKQNKFDALIKEADDKFAAENYVEAISSYEKALAIISGNSYAKLQIDESRKRIALKNADLAEAEYKKIITEADGFFDSKSYDKARDSYNKALGIRPADAYPKKKLEEIDAILNPVIVKSQTLEDLGDPYDNSIMDGYAALVKADMERKNNKATSMKDVVDEIKAEETVMTEAKTIDQQETTNEIYMIQNSIALADEERDLGRQESVEGLDAIDEALAEEEMINGEFKQNDLLISQDKLNTAVNESALDYTQREGVYTENTEKLGNVTNSYNDEMNERLNNEGSSNVSADQKLIVVQEKIDRESDDNYDERKKTELAVGAIVEKSVVVEESIASSTYDQLLLNDQEITVVEDLVEMKTAEDAKAPGSNKEELKIVESAVVSMEETKTEQQLQLTKENSAAIEEVNISIVEADVERDLNRQETVESLDNGRMGIEDAEMIAYENETVKYLQNQNEIQVQTNKNNGISEKAEESHAINVSSITIIDEKATVVHEEIALSDDEQRLRARANVEMINANAEESNVNSTKKQEENAVKLDDATKTIDTEKTNKENSETEKHYSTQAKLNTLESKPVEKVRVANSLGQEYPEGVSQESFTQSDENGLMTAIITRRVVVIDGEGTVYVRTQTLHAITYTKNGEPTTEYTWQKETQGAHLERHF